MFPLGSTASSVRNVTAATLPKYLTNPIRDFFLANTWSLLRPGGVLMHITSRFALDKKEDCVISSRTPAMLPVAVKLMRNHDAAKKLIRAETLGVI